MQSLEVKYSAVQRSKVQGSAKRLNTVHCCTVQECAEYLSTGKCSDIGWSKVGFNSVQCCFHSGEMHVAVFCFSLFSTNLYTAKITTKFYNVLNITVKWFYTLQWF